MARTIIRNTPTGNVEVIGTDPYSGEAIHWTFTCPRQGGYVRFAGGSMRQVCDGLGTTGATLVAGGKPGDLLALIRREWAVRRRDAAKGWAA